MCIRDRPRDRLSWSWTWTPSHHPQVHTELYCQHVTTNNSPQLGTEMMFARRGLIWMLAGLGSSISLPAAFQPAETSVPQNWFGSSCGITGSDTNSILLNPWPIKHTFTMAKYAQHKQVRGITRISHSLLCCCQRFRQSLVPSEGSTSQMHSTYKPQPLDEPMHSLKCQRYLLKTFWYLLLPAPCQKENIWNSACLWTASPSQPLLDPAPCWSWQTNSSTQISFKWSLEHVKLFLQNTRSI